MAAEVASRDAQQSQALKCVDLDTHAALLFPPHDDAEALESFAHYATRRAQILQSKVDAGRLSDAQSPGHDVEYLRLRRRIIMSTIKQRAVDIGREEYNARLARLDRQESSHTNTTGLHPSESNTSLTDLSESTTGFGGGTESSVTAPSTPTGLYQPTITPSVQSVTQRQRQRAMTMQNTVSHAYAFGGLHHLFVEHLAAITTVKFANYDADLLAFASLDGVLSIARVKKDPRVVHTLKGHTKGILDFEWSQSNEFILSTSEDKSLRLWDTEGGKCLRIVYHTEVSPCIAFHPINGNSFLSVSGAKGYGYLNFFNLSTGRLGYQVKTDSPLRSLVIPPDGIPLYTGDEKGNVSIFTIDRKGRYRRSRGSYISLCPGHAVTWLSYNCWSVGEKIPYLLANCGDGQVRMLRCIEGTKPTLAITHKFQIVQRKQTIRNCFCPLISHRGGACVVSGSEDANIYIFDVMADRDGSCINKLQGHSSAVRDVAWNYDETLLASGDADGQVFLWKRQQTTNTTEGIVDDVSDVYL